MISEQIRSKPVIVETLSKGILSAPNHNVLSRRHAVNNKRKTESCVLIPYPNPSMPENNPRQFHHNLNLVLIQG